MTLEEQLNAPTCSERLRNVRTHRGLKQIQVAARADIVQNKLSGWEVEPLNLERARH